MDAYMLIDGIDGSSKAAGMEDHFDVLNFSHSAARQTDAGAGNVAGHIKHSAFTVNKWLDKGTPQLWDMCNSNLVKDVTVKLVRIEGAESSSEGGERVVYMTYTMTKCRLASISVSGGGGGEAVETLGFVYKDITWTYSGLDGNTESFYDADARMG